MRELLVERNVELYELKVCYDMDNRRETVCLTYESAKVVETIWPVTEKQLAGIFTALYDKRCEPIQIIRKYNYIKNPVKCTLVFVQGILVAIGNINEMRYCELKTGEVITEVELYKTCKEEIKEELVKEIEYYTKILNELVERYEKITNK